MTPQRGYRLRPFQGQQIGSSGLLPLRYRENRMCMLSYSVLRTQYLYSTHHFEELRLIDHCDAQSTGLVELRAGIFARQHKISLLAY
jgi:hypothetical protein